MGNIQISRSDVSIRFFFHSTPLIHHVALPLLRHITLHLCCEGPTEVKLFFKAHWGECVVGITPDSLNCDNVSRLNCR